MSRMSFRKLVPESACPPHLGSALYSVSSMSKCAGGEGGAASTPWPAAQKARDMMVSSGTLEATSIRNLVRGRVRGRGRGRVVRPGFVCGGAQGGRGAQGCSLGGARARRTSP